MDAFELPLKGAVFKDRARDTAGFFLSQRFCLGLDCKRLNIERYARNYAKGLLEGGARGNGAFDFSGMRSLLAFFVNLT